MTATVTVKSDYNTNCMVVTINPALALRGALSYIKDAFQKRPSTYQSYLTSRLDMPIDPDEAIERMYYFELERRRALYSQLSIPTAVLTVFGGIIGYFMRSYEPVHPVATFFFVVSLIFAIVWFFVAFWNAFRSLQGGWVTGLTDPMRVHSAVVFSENDESVSYELRKAMAVAAASLRDSNERRETYLFNAYQSILLTAYGLISATVFYMLRTDSVWSDIIDTLGF